MEEYLDEVQECRIYKEAEWPRLIEYVQYLKHQRPYLYGAELAAGGRVLDFGCGSGYGSAILAERAAEVVGVDASAISIAHCREHYRRANLSFVKIEPDYTLPFEDDSFDLVISCQVIEHIRDVVRYLHLLNRVVKPDGRVLLTTCNRVFRLLPFQPPWNPAHYREYSPRTLEREVTRVFSRCELRGVAGKEHAHRVYVEAYRPRLIRAYVYLPLRRMARACIPGKFYSGLVRQRDRARPAPARPPVAREVLNRYSVDDFQVSEDLSRALDLLCKCRKEVP